MHATPQHLRPTSVRPVGSGRSVVNILDDMRRYPRGRTAIRVYVIVGLILCIAFAAVTPPTASWGASQTAPHCVVHYPTYDHCSKSQIDDIEMGTAHRFRRHYAEPHRWGQKPHAFSGLSAVSNAKLRKGYHRAVQRYYRHHLKSGLRHPTWASFKSAAYCAGSFSAMSPVQWCGLNPIADRAIATAAGTAVHVVIGCRGAVLEGAASAAAGSLVLGVAITPTGMGAVGAAAVTACVVHRAWGWVHEHTWFKANRWSTAPAG
jgi:hypothetical protein